MGRSHACLLPSWCCLFALREFAAATLRVYAAYGGGRITLTDTPKGTEIAYVYEAEIGGKVASVGGRLLDGAAKVVIGEFFRALARHAGGGGGGSGPLGRVRRAVAGGRATLATLLKGGRS